MSERTELPTVDDERTERCETCRFSEHYDQGPHLDRPVYRCLRYPPKWKHEKSNRDHDDDGMDVPFNYDVPYVEDADWCGEWKPKVGG